MIDINVIREKFIHYMENPNQYFDLDSAWHYDEDIYKITKKPLSTVLGLKTLGRGHFSAVFDLGDDRVLKINHEGKHDAGYHAFAEYAMVNPSPHLPKIYHIDTWAGHHVYVIEKLEEPTQFDRQLMLQLSRTEHDPSRPMSKFLKPDVVGPEFPLLVQRLRDQCSGSWSMRWDLHDENMMMRGDTIVITDPWGGSC